MKTLDPTGSLVQNLSSDNRVLRLAWYGLLAVGGTILLTLSAKTKVMIGPVDLSLQTLAVFLIGAAFGSRLAVATVLLYLAEGLAGFPVFQGSPEKGLGLAYMVGPTGGFLVGFALAAFIVGLAADRGWDRSLPRLLAALLVAEMAILVPGFLWLSGLIGAGKAWQFGIAPFLLADALKIALAATLVPAVWAAVSRLRG